MAKKILIVDDDVTLVEMYSERLKAEGFEVEAAPDGVECLLKTKEWKPDLILLDIMMPKKNGFETLEELKSSPETESIPVIMLSALIQGENKTRVKSVGAIGYIIKSETMPGEVLEEVKKAIS